MSDIFAFLMIVLIAAGALAGCGGGGSESTSKPVVSLYGDSLTTGAAGAGYLEVPPTQRLAQLRPNYDFQLRGVSGAVVHQAVYGDPPNWPWEPFGDQAEQDNTQVVVIRFGGADAILGTDAESFRADLTTMVRQAQNEGMRVLVVGVIPCPPYAERSALMDQINREVAAEQGVTFINLRDLPFDTAVDIAPGDSVHPSQAYSDRIAERIASYF